MKRGVKWLAITALAAVVLVTAGTWVYINVIRDDPPGRLTLDAGKATATTVPTAPPTSSAGSDSSDSGVDGAWAVSTGSEAGYRVGEILFGQKSEAVGRTKDVTGQIQVDGTNVISGSFTVDMTTVASNESRRDGQFRGRIMDVATYPTSTFRLTRPIAFGTLPPDGAEIAAKATGELTLRGTTKVITVDLKAMRSSGSLRILGTIPITFDEWGIPNPSGVRPPPRTTVNWRSSWSCTHVAGYPPWPFPGADQPGNRSLM